MGDVAIPPDESIDAPALRVDPEFDWWDRSQSRTPMPWSGDRGAGFTTAARPWLRVGPDAAGRNVAAQDRDPTSVLACYRRVIAARRACRALQDGSLTLVRGLPADVLAYRRRAAGPVAGEALVIVAFGPAGVELEIPRPRGGGGWQVLVGSHVVPSAPDHARRIAVRPYEAVVLTAAL